MAIINSYPIEVPTATDLIVFSDVSNGNVTKSATVQSIANLANAVQLGYTSLVQLLTQTGTAAPVGLEVHNNTGGTFTWTRQSSGNYTITASASLFTANKTLVFLNAGHGYQAALPIYWERVSDTAITLNAFSDGEIEEGSFEVKIYN